MGALTVSTLKMKKSEFRKFKSSAEMSNGESIWFLCSTTTLYCFTEGSIEANGTVLQEEGFQLCKQKPGTAEVISGLTCAIGGEGISSAGNLLAESRLLKREYFTGN